MKQKTIKSQTTQILYRPPRPEEMVSSSSNDWFKPFLMVLLMFVTMTACSYKVLFAASDEQIRLAEKNIQLNKGSRK